VRNGRDDLGRFLTGGPAGPGRPRKGRRSPRALVLFEALRAAVNAQLEADDALELEDVLGATELLVRRAREVVRAGPESGASSCTEEDTPTRARGERTRQTPTPQRAREGPCRDRGEGPTA